MDNVQQMVPSSPLTQALDIIETGFVLDFTCLSIYKAEPSLSLHHCLVGSLCQHILTLYLLDNFCSVLFLLDFLDWQETMLFLDIFWGVSQIV